MERRTPSRASTIIAADDFDAVVQRRRWDNPPASSARPRRIHPPPAARCLSPLARTLLRLNTRAPHPAGRTRRPPPLDGTGWSGAANTGAHFAIAHSWRTTWTYVLDAIEFELDDDDVVMSNKQRKALIKQRDEALEIMRFAERGGGGIGGGGAAGMGRPRSVPTRELSGQPSLQPPSAGPPLTSTAHLDRRSATLRGAERRGRRISTSRGQQAAYNPAAAGKGTSEGCRPTAAVRRGGAQFGNGGASTSMGGGYGWDQHGGEGRQFVGGGQYDSFGQFGGGGGGGGQFEDRQWEDFGPAPGEAAASIPEVNCQFVDHEIKKWSVETFEWSPRASIRSPQHVQRARFPRHAARHHQLHHGG